MGGRHAGDRLHHFVDTTWFGRGGLFHSADMHIIEKLTRKGDEILYEMTIEDPDVVRRALGDAAANAAAQRELPTPDLCRSARIAKCTKQATSAPSFDTNRSLVTRTLQPVSESTPGRAVCLCGTERSNYVGRVIGNKRNGPLLAISMRETPNRHNDSHGRGLPKGYFPVCLD